MAADTAHTSIWTRIYRNLLKIYGPAQLGDSNAPVRAKPVYDPPCSLCGRPSSEHVLERTAEASRMHCPTH